MCNKACSWPTFQQPRRCSTPSVPSEASRCLWSSACHTPSYFPPVLRNLTHVPVFTWHRPCKQGRHVVGCPLSFLIRCVLFATCPWVLSSHCLMSTQASVLEGDGSPWGLTSHPCPCWCPSHGCPELQRVWPTCHQLGSLAFTHIPTQLTFTLEAAPLAFQSLILWAFDCSIDWVGQVWWPLLPKAAR